MGVKCPSKNAEKIVCKICDFQCSKQSDWSRHILTRKHKNRTNLNNLEQKNAENNGFTCKSCDKHYKARNSLWYHEQKCTNVEKKNAEIIINLDNSEKVNNSDEKVINNDDGKGVNNNNNNKNTDNVSSSSEIKLLTNIVLEIIKSNNEIQKQNQLIQTHILSSVGKPSHTINNTNSHNKTFNLQFFLNEKCKDAMNITEFVESFTLQLSDLKSVGRLGYVEGITNIMTKKLNEMDIYKRPVHCSDAKRDTLYVKDENTWEKESSDYSKLRKAIKYISKKNSDLLTVWSDENPASKNIASHLNEEYMRLIQQAMGGNGEIDDNETKIIKKISKLVLIDKMF